MNCQVGPPHGTGAQAHDVESSCAHTAARADGADKAGYRRTWKDSKCAGEMGGEEGGRVAVGDDEQQQQQVVGSGL